MTGEIANKHVPGFYRRPGNVLESETAITISDCDEIIGSNQLLVVNDVITVAYVVVVVFTEILVVTTKKGDQVRN